MGVYRVPPGDAIAAFFNAMCQRGLDPPPDLIADGRMHRCRVEGARSGKRDGAYRLFFDEHPAGGFQNWKDGLGWQEWRYSNGTTTLTPTERAVFDAKVAVRKKADQEKNRCRAEKAQHEAVAWFGNADPADPRHPYLIEKRVRAHGLRQRGTELLVPRRDARTDELVNLQRITSSGDKLNLKDGRVDGTWFIIGTPQARGTILLAEGFATAATGHEVTGHAAVVSFGSGNLVAVAVELRRQHPQAHLVFLADDDWRQKDNPGLTKATEAARAVDAFMAVPTFGPDREEKDADFNDMRRLVGADAVRTAIEKAAKPPTDWPEIDPALVEGAQRDIPVFPVHLLPSSWRKWTVATAEGAGAPIDYVAMGLMADVAGVTGCGAFVEVTPSWREPLVLWQGNVGAPSMGKSPALAATRRLIDAVESAARAKDAERQREHETKAEAAKVAEERWREEVAEAAKAGKPPPTKPASADHIDPFVPTQMLVEDATIESIVDVARGNPRGLILCRDELTGWLQNFARYSGGNDRPFWLERWSAGSATINRKNRPAIHIARLGVSIVGGIQPDRLSDICGDDDDGMASRFLFAWPNRPQYKPLQERRAGSDDKVVKRLHRMAALTGNVEKPLVLKLDAGAVKLLDEFCAEHHAEADEYEGLEAGWFGKGRGYVVRLAGVLSLLAWSETDNADPPSVITSEAVRDAAGLWADYLWPVARTIFARTGKTLADRQVRRIIAWIRRTATSTISVEDVRVSALGRVVDAAAAAALIDRLIRGNVLRPVAAAAKGGPGRPAARWEVNPALHTPKPEVAHA
jgi:phage/plasmid primase-like uncharacterized protein